MLWTGLNRGHEPREQQDMVDDVNHAVTGHDISCRHFGLTVHINTLGVFRDGELLFFQGRHILRGLECGGRDIARHNMVENDLHKQFVVGRFQKLRYLRREGLQGITRLSF